MLYSISGGVSAVTIAIIVMIYGTVDKQALGTSNQTSLNETGKNIKALDIFSVSNASGPTLAANSGSIFATYLLPTIDESKKFESTYELSGNLYTVGSGDGGKTFTEPVRVNKIPEEASYKSYNAAPARFGPNGEVYVLWQHASSNHSKIEGMSDFRLAMSSDGGKTFGPEINPTANELPSYQQFGELAVSNNGTVIVGYMDIPFVTFESENGTNMGFYDMDSIDYVNYLTLQRSEDGGKTFDKIMLDEDACGCCDIAATKGPDGEIYYAWRDSEREVAQPNNYSDPYISTYGNETQEEYYSGINDMGKTAYDHGLIDLPTEYSTSRDIVISHTTDGGKGLEWSEPVRVQDKLWFYNGCPSVGPSIQFDSTGRLHALYFTGAGEDGMTGYYHVYSDDMGKTFSTPHPVFTSDFVAVTHTNTDLTIDKNDNIWVSFVTYPDETAGTPLEMKKILNVYAIDRQGNIIDNETFRSNTISSPSSVSTEEGAFISYSDNEGTR